MTTSPLLVARPVRHRRRPRDRPDLPPRGRPAGVRGVPARGGGGRPGAAAQVLRRVRRRRPQGGHGPAARDPDLAGQPRLGGEGRLRPRRAGPREPARRRASSASRPRRTPTSTRCCSSGRSGPRGDGYVAGDTPDPDEAAEYHVHQIRSFAAAGADLVSAMTITSPEEAIGVVARRPVGRPPGRDRLHRRDRRPAARRHAAAGCDRGRRRRRRPGLVPRQLRPPHPHRPRVGRRRVAVPDRRHPPQRLDDDARGAGRDGGARRGRPAPARLLAGRPAPAAAVAGDRRRLLRHRRPARGRALGRRLTRT